MLSWYSYKEEICKHGCEPPACLQLPIPLGQLSHTSIMFFVKLSKRWKTNALKFCKKCGEFCGNFLSEMQ